MAMELRTTFMRKWQFRNVLANGHFLEKVRTERISHEQRGLVRFRSVYIIVLSDFATSTVCHRQTARDPATRCTMPNYHHSQTPPIADHRTVVLVI